MTYSFNLIDQKWIPCVYPDGQVEQFSLRDVLVKAHTLRSIQGDSPIETAAIFRLLLAVLHSALRGPHDQSEWAALWKQGKWPEQVVTGYLDQWHNRFDLFDPARPFYQAKDERVRKKSIISLVMDMASGNNASLFDHHTEDQGAILSPAKAARTLITAQTTGLAGLCLPGCTFTDGPWARGIIFFVEGDNLFQTLAFNLLRYPNDQVLSYTENDLPAWESDDAYEPMRKTPRGYLDYLTWQNRRILLIPENDSAGSPCVQMVTMAPGLRLDAGILDPMKLYRKGKDEGFLVNRFSEDRALWRDSAALFGLRSDRGNYPPKSFYWLANLVAEGIIPQRHAYRFMALGMANDQAKVEFFQEDHLPLPVDYLEQDELVEQLSTALDLAEKTCFALRVATQWMALLVLYPKEDGKKWQEVGRLSKEQAGKLVFHWNVERFYWQQLGLPFFHLLEDLPKDSSALAEWKTRVRQTAWQALDQAANFAGVSAVAIKAEVRARGSLGYALKELYPEPQNV